MWRRADSVRPRLEAEQHGIQCLRLYGATEVLVATWNRPLSPEHKKIDTDGPPLPGVEIEVRDLRRSTRTSGPAR